MNGELKITYLKSLTASSMERALRGNSSKTIICTNQSQEAVGSAYKDLNHDLSLGQVFLLSIKTPNDIQDFKNTVREQNRGLVQKIDTSLNVKLQSRIRELLGAPNLDENALGPKTFQFTDRKWFNMACRSDVPVLLYGESGSGKTEFAKLIHERSRELSPFVDINMAAFSRELIDSELYGHKKSSFTGANFEKKGHFEAADGGTLFLDEIAELDLDLQAKLLKAIHEDSSQVKVYKVGSEKETKLNVRIIAATNRPLENITESSMRKDLFNRFPIRIRVPTLKEYIQSDIDRGEQTNGTLSKLVKLFRDRYALTRGLRVPEVTPEGFTYLKNQLWPGNIRQLKNVLHNCLRFREATLSLTSPITAEELQEVYEYEQKFTGFTGTVAGETKPKKILSDEKDVVERTVQIEQEYAHFLMEVKKVMKTDSAAARQLGLHYTTFTKRLNEAKKRGRVEL